MRVAFRPPAWVTGGLSTGDAAFLAALVRRVQPWTVLELGVAAGTSSAALLVALDQLPEPSRRTLYSADVRSTCYFDPSYATGAAVAEMYPNPRSRWCLDVDGATARVATARNASAWTRRGIDLAFIDADHRHPWPLLDVLHLAPWLRREAWIALHDIALARLCPAFQSHGAEWLFDAWPWAKRAGTGDAENIGAIQLPADLAALVPVAGQLLGARWEATPPRAERTLPAPFAGIFLTQKYRIRETRPH